MELGNRKKDEVHEMKAGGYKRNYTICEEPVTQRFIQKTN